MANIQETRNLRLNSSISNLALMASDLEQILRGIDDSSLYKTLRNSRQSVQKPTVTLEAALESGDEEPPPNATHGTAPAPEVQ